ncbi:MAG: ADP-ribosylglycohydrolase family protein [Lachnospiraceae bacterium]|nr:ADP-ribosylglycohydrolase family protein [Lachnospiraceae bacterium]
MYGAIIGDFVGFLCEKQGSIAENFGISLLRRESSESAGQTAQAGEAFSDKTVLTAGLEEGLLSFEKKLPGLLAGDRTGGRGKNTFEEAFCEETAGALRRFGQASPLAGYPMDLSIWLFREGTEASAAEQACAAARVSPVAWMFQEDLYMMRHLARLQTKLTHQGKESVRAADAAACAVFLAIHACTKDYIRTFLERTFGYRIPEPEAVRQEILQAGSAPEPSLCLRAALSAFLYGKDFEDVLRRAVSPGGASADIAAIAGAVAEAFFGIPDEWREACRERLPQQILQAADAFSLRMSEKKKIREENPAARARWESALTRASERHPAAVQGNEPLEEAIDRMLEKKDQQSLVAALEMLRLRMNQRGRVFVPILSAQPGENSAGMAPDAGQSTGTGLRGTTQEADSSGGKRGAQETGSAGGPGAVKYRMQAVRTRDGRLWQPAYTSRAKLERAYAAQEAAAKAAGSSEKTQERGSLVLSYALDALLKRFLPQDPDQTAAQLQGIVLNPYDRPFFLARKTIEALFVVDREAKRITDISPKSEERGDSSPKE